MRARSEECHEYPNTKHDPEAPWKEPVTGELISEGRPPGFPLLGCVHVFPSERNGAT